jgi:hypothetical protein
MKYLALLGLAAAVVLCPVVAQADWSENFDSYALGSGMIGQGGWDGWGGDINANAYVSNVQFQSSPHSVAITGASDLVHPYDGYVTGQWIYTAYQYIPTDFSGTTYFLLLNTYTSGGDYNWSTQVSFVSAGGYIQNDYTLDQLPMIRGRWVEIRVEIDLDADTQTFYYDNQMLYSSSWTEGMSGGGALNIGTVDLYANNASPVYYDDMSLLPGGGAPRAVCCVAQDCFVITEQECAGMQGVYHPEWDSCGPPNPCETTPAEPTSWGSVKSLFR